MQYMLGLSEFSDRPVFDSSLFVTIRKRLQVEDLNAFTHSLLTVKDSDQQDDDSAGDNQDHFIDSQGRVHKGDMKIDATCSDAEVRYPTDLDLLNDGIRVINRYIAKLCGKFSLPLPVSFQNQSRKVYLEAIRRKRKTGKMINACKSHMLTYLIRDIRSFMELIAIHGTQLLDGLGKSEQRTMQAIINMYHQQNGMFKAGVHSCTDRIISIFQPHCSREIQGPH